MREVRMTFGEHLEELRRHLIFCIIYLVVGVAIAMTYGKELMKLTVGPHERAIRGAQRDRLVVKMAKTLRRLEVLTSTRPVELQPDEKPLLDAPPEPADWAVLFARDVALPQIEGRLKEPALRLRQAIEGLSGLPAADRARLGSAVEAFGAEVATTVATELTPGVELPGMGDLRGRFGTVGALLQTAQRDLALSKVKEAVGWSQDLQLVLEPLARFLRFLDERRAQVAQAAIPLPLLHERARVSRLPAALNEVLISLEADARAFAEERPIPLMVINYLESAMTYLKVSLYFGVFFALPFLLYEIWKFVGAGLYPHEQKYIVTLLPFSLGLFLVGILFGYYGMIPVGLEFLASWGIEDVSLNFTLESYIGLFFTLTLLLGLVFQTPLVMVFFLKIGVVDVNAYRRMRRIAIFVGVVLAVVLTPPDPFSWALMAAPMILLYEVGILACRVLSRREPQPSSAAQGSR